MKRPIPHLYDQSKRPLRYAGYVPGHGDLSIPEIRYPGPFLFRKLYGFNILFCRYIDSDKSHGLSPFYGLRHPIRTAGCCSKFRCVGGNPLSNRKTRLARPRNMADVAYVCRTFGIVIIDDFIAFPSMQQRLHKNRHLAAGH